jgi:hypothetical protein
MKAVLRPIAGEAYVRAESVSSLFLGDVTVLRPSIAAATDGDRDRGDTYDEGPTGAWA